MTDAALKEALLSVIRPLYFDETYTASSELVTAVEAIMNLGLTKAPESLFWYWIAERHAIYLRRQEGQPKPWTSDPILQRYKFTNPFREHDTGTVWLREYFLEPHRDAPLDLIAFNICWYRMFNWTGTGEILGWQTSWPAESHKETLHFWSQAGRQIFTGAHIVRSAGGRPKIDATVDVCSALYNLRSLIVQRAHETNRLEHVFNLLCQVDYIGGFMAFEMVTDMRHTRLLENAVDIYTWANMGPGAKRGLLRLGMPCTGQAEGCASMRALLAHAGSGLAAAGVSPIAGNPEWPIVEMRDIEHSLCEFDKYCRVKFGEGEPRSKYPGV